MGGGGGGGSIKTFRDILNILPTSFSRPALYVTAFFFFFPPLNLSPKCENRPGKTQALELGSSIIGSHFWPQLQGQDTSRLSTTELPHSNRIPCNLVSRDMLCLFVCLFIYLFEQVDVDLLYPPNHTLTKDSHNTGNFVPYSSRIRCGFLNVPQGTYEHERYL